MLARIISKLGVYLFVPLGKPGVLEAEHRVLICMTFPKQ